MANIKQLKLPDNTTYDLKDESGSLSSHWHHDEDLKPLISKTYASTSYYASANTNEDATWLFMSVKPDDWYKPWTIKFKVYSYCPSYTGYKHYTYSTITGRSDGAIYCNWNEKYNTVHTYISGYLLKKAGFDAGYGHAIGINIVNADNRTSSAYYRTFEIDYYECENCTVEFLETPVKWVNWTGAGTTYYNGIVNWDATNRGLRESGDDNELNQRVQYFSGKTGAVGIWGGSLFMQDGNGTYQNICTASDGTVTSANRTTATTKIANTHGFTVGSPIYYCNSNYNANTQISGSAVVYTMLGTLFDSRYAFNTTLTANSLTPYASLYLVGTINATDGLYYLDQTWWTQTPNDTNKIYVLVGACYDSTTSYCRIVLYEQNKWYKYDGSKLVELTNGHIVSKDVPANAVFTDNSGDDKLPLAGGTLTGPLGISYGTTATMTYNSTNPQIAFSENGQQGVKIIYSDYDSYRSPYGLKVIGDGSNAAGAWFEVEGDLYAKNLNATNVNANLNPEKITSGYLESRVYHNIHPENGGGIIPFINNDLAFLTKKGGSYSFYSTTATDYTTDTISGTAISTSLTAVFDASPTYASVNRPQDEIDVIEITCHKMFTYSNVFYIDFGATNWRAKDIIILVRNNNTETTWTQKATVSNSARGHWWCAVSHTSTSGGSTVQGFNQIRVVLKNWNNSAGRIAQVGLINYNSAGVNETFISRGGCNGIYGDLIPNENSSMNLGSSSKKWLNAYVTNINGTAVGNAIGKNYTTSVTSGSADLVTSGAVYTAIANLPEPMVMKGTLGTGGTITSLPTASASNEGYTYKVITDGTYASQSAKVGDLFVSYNPSGSTYSWLLIPSGDETTSDTWRNIKVNGTEKLGNAISTGAVDFVNGTGTTVGFNATGNKVSVNVTYGSDANTACQGNDSRLSDARTPTSHTHGNIQNGGTLQTNDITIASGDKLVVTDSSDSNKVARTSVSFDGSTTSTALTPKGTFESFAKASDITSAINALDGGTIGTPSTSKTVTALSETNGQISATFSDIAIANTQVSGLGTASTKDVPTSGNASTTQVVMGNDTRLSDSRTPTSHTHGNITNGGALQTNDITVASGDKLVVTDSSDSNKVARTSVSFDGSTTNKALTPKGTFEDFAQHYGDLTPIMSKTFTNVIATADNFAGGWFFYGKIQPTDYYTIFKIHYKITSIAAGRSDSKTICDVWVCGTQSSLLAYSSFNTIANGNYLAQHNNEFYRATSAGITNQYGHLLGVRLQSAWNRTVAANSRTITIDILEVQDCAFTFFDSMTPYANVPGSGSTNYSAYSDLNGTSSGLQETGDSDNVDNIMAYFNLKTGVQGIWNGSLVMQDGNGTYQNICTASDGTATNANRTTANTKLANTNGFRVGGTIYYSSGNYNANTNITSWGHIRSMQGNLFDARYCFNVTLTANSLTPYAPIYLVGTINSTDGLFYLDQTWWTQTPTATDKVYVLVGGCYDSTTSNCRISLLEHNPWYKYDGSKLVEIVDTALHCSDASTVNGHTVNSDVPANAQFTDTTYTGTGAISVDPSTHVISTTAEVNQNAFSNVKVGSTTIQADSKTDTLELVAGNNVTLTPDATNDKITISATDTTYTSEQEAQGGTDLSLVTTGEKYTWNHATGTDTIPSGYCDTAGGTAAKVVQLTGYTNTANQIFMLTLVNANTYAGEITLNVNSTGAKTLYIDGQASSASNYTLPAGSYLVSTSDGTKYSLRTDGKQPINISGKAEILNVERSGANVNSLVSNTNSFAIKEYYNTASNVPDNAYYYVFGAMGGDTNYAVQLAIGETSNNVWLRRKNSGSWDSWRPILYLNNNANGLFQVLRGVSMSTNTAGYWAAMLSSGQAGSPTLPTAGKWWHVLSMDWNDATIGSTASTNWTSQLAIATRDGNGVWWRRNTANTSIESATWNRLAEGDANGSATSCNGFTLGTSVPSNAVFTDKYVESKRPTVGNTATTLYPMSTTHFSTTASQVTANEGGMKLTLGRDFCTMYLIDGNGNEVATFDSSLLKFKYGGLNGGTNQRLVLWASNETDYYVYLSVRESAWSFAPAVTKKLRLGSASYLWTTVYAQTGSINTSDRNEKKDIVPLDETAKDFIMALNPVSYKFKDGESGRTHYGMIAQDVEEEMEELGMTPMDFAGFCKDQKTVPFKREVDGKIIDDAMPVEGEYSYGLRYEEFIPAVIKTVQLQQEEINDLRTELDELKNELAQIKAMLNGGN